MLPACQKDDGADSSESSVMSVPKGFPPIEFPSDNEYTPERWELGKKLFFDPALSLNQTVSCASCHQPHLAFSDDKALSVGDLSAVGKSNSPSLTNVAWSPSFTRAGGSPTLEMQVLIPIQDHDEFNYNIVDLAERLSQIPEYQLAAQSCYNRDMDPYVITRAIANFERSLISGNSRYDRFAQFGVFNALSASERNGMNLFFSDRTNCASCHGDFNFTLNEFENNGLYEIYRDSGRMRLTGLESDRGRFKVPTLRNISVSGPYMHDGYLETLEEVVAHYNNGGSNHPNKSELIRPLGLTEEERHDLESFLRTLTDYEFLSNPNLKP